ncbi:MAG: hypothetical protein VYC17_02375 [Nitrospinota bacterium]|nr:hypothetical protein [Nitrospinota bacterium]
MHEVKVFDAEGNLKKIISVKTLNKRLEKEINSPSLYKKNRKSAVAKAPKKQAS